MNHKVKYNNEKQGVLTMILDINSLVTTMMAHGNEEIRQGMGKYLRYQFNCLGSRVLSVSR